MKTYKVTYTKKNGSAKRSTFVNADSEEKAVEIANTLFPYAVVVCGVGELKKERT